MSTQIGWDEGAPRFEFGRNWHDFIQRNFGAERVGIAEGHLLDFLDRESLEGLDVLDIGCGSGLHSIAMLEAGALSVHGFDYDPLSVEATRFVQRETGHPPNWTVEQGSVLDDAYVEKLPLYDLVYSWGVLHHTGDVWHAIRNAASRVKPGGLFYIAVYSSDVSMPETPQFWLELKREYVSSGWVKRRFLEFWYIWKYHMGGRLRKLPRVVRKAREYGKRYRGMSFFTDVRDWLGGWPMEYVADQEAVDFVIELGFGLERMVTGEANTEFLFKRLSSAE